MATFSLRATVTTLFLGLVISSFVCTRVSGADPDITTDLGINVISDADLHFTGFKDLPQQPHGKLKINFAFATQFPSIRGLGIAPVYLKFGPNSINPFHSHPRASEISIIIDGELDAGILDTANHLYIATLKKGDVFMFLRGLMHFQINRSKNKTATVVAAFNSENGGHNSIPPAIFNSEPRIETNIIMRSLHLDKQTVKYLKMLQFPSVS